MLLESCDGGGRRRGKKEKAFLGNAVCVDKISQREKRGLQLFAKSFFEMTHRDGSSDSSESSLIDALYCSSSSCTATTRSLASGERPCPKS